MSEFWSDEPSVYMYGIGRERYDYQVRNDGPGHKSHIYGSCGVIPGSATRCVILGNNVHLTTNDDLIDAIYIDTQPINTTSCPDKETATKHNTKIYVTIDGKFVNIIDKLVQLEQKVDMLLYAPGGPMYELAKQSFEETQAHPKN